MYYELSGYGLTAVIDSHGGELISFKDNNGTEYIWEGKPEYWAGRNPLLFPIVGNLKNATVSFNGTEYHMSRHGFARDNEFSVIEQSEDHVVLKLKETAETLEKYPYPFALQVRQQLVKDGFITGFSVENTGTEPMPFCIGAHTAFRCPMKEGERFEDYEIVFDQPEKVDMKLLTKEGLISHELTEPFLQEENRYGLGHEVFARVDTIILEGLKSTGIQLTHKETGEGIRMEFEEFPMLAFWTKGAEKAPFICLEPWHGCAAVDNESGEFTDKPHCMILQPGEKKELSYKVVKAW